MNELELSQVNFTYGTDRVSRLRKHCCKHGVLGQPRALSALKMGMSINSRGYNIYISGEDGTGRHSAVLQIAQELGKKVVEERNPTYENVFGWAYEDESGNIVSAHGSLYMANGGFLVLDAHQVVNDDVLWKAIKVFAETKTLSIKCYDKENGTHVKSVIKEQLDVKIILLGSDDLYDRLCDTEEKFLKLFKVCAEFDFSMPADDDNVSGTIAYILGLAAEKNLKNVTDDALCELLSYSSRYAEMRDELTTKLSNIGDLLLEADYCARDCIDANAVRKALAERDFANGITESRITEEIKNGEMIISLEGTKVGVINGLAVMDRGLVSFGTPAVISVSVAPGCEGIVNIEHEAGLSGEIHDKGLLILEGYLRKQYARTFPLSVYAGICFEQSYSEVDGDSASSSELFALLSAIGNLPVRQDIAVTGSVNQLGDIQPVGGINEKICGFFDICQVTGLTGRQGVIIPRQNIKSLILPGKIVQAVTDRKFHIYPISSIDEGMEILTLRPSGTRNAKGNFPPDTVNRIIEDRLKKLYELSKPSN